MKVEDEKKGPFLPLMTGEKKQNQNFFFFLSIKYQNSEVKLMMKITIMRSNFVEKSNSKILPQTN